MKCCQPHESFIYNYVRDPSSQFRGRQKMLQTCQYPVTFFLLWESAIHFSSWLKSQKLLDMSLLRSLLSPPKLFTISLKKRQVHVWNFKLLSLSRFLTYYILYWSHFLKYYNVNPLHEIFHVFPVENYIVIESWDGDWELVVG